MSTTSCAGIDTTELVESSSSGSVVYTGTLSGNAFVTVTPANGTGPVKLYINNMKVEVVKKDSGGDTVVGNGVTGEGGAFAVAYSTDSKGSSIELYLRFVAESGDGMIRVRKKGVFDKWSRTQEVLKRTPLVVLSTSPDVSPPDQGDIELDKTELKPQLLHWANRAREFVTAELGSASPLPTDPAKPLDILTPPLTQGAQSFFVPATMVDDIFALVGAVVLPFVVPVGGLVLIYFETQFSDEDAVYISETNDDDDGTTMHELGHYVMWYAQGKKWLNPLEAGFAKHYTHANSSNSKIAWTEGFADGFARIVDAWSFADDQEDDSDTPKWVVESLGIFGTIVCGAGTGPTCNSQATSHGFFSELYIDHIIYDLWDGPTNLVAGPNAIAPTGISYTDSGGDNIELSFAEIMQPILDTKTGNQGSLIGNIVDYHGRLYAQQHDRAIKDLFVTSSTKTPATTAGRIRNLQLGAVGNPVLQDIPNTDPIAFVRTVEVELFNLDSTTAFLVSSKGRQSEPFTLDVPGLYRATDDYNLGAMLLSNALTLSDDLVVDGSAALGSATLSFNSRTRPIGWRLAGNSYAAPVGVLVSAGPQLNVTIAAGTKLSARDRGTMVLGDPANGQMASVTVASGATLVLGGGAGGDYPQADLITGQMVSKGKVFIHRGSKLIIERGGKLVINKGAEITLDGIGAEMIIRGDLEVSPDATFWWSSSGGALVTFALPNAAGAANVTMGANAHILIHEVPFVIANNTYLRLPEVTPSRLTIENGARGHFGTAAYLDAGTKAMITLDDSVIDALGAGLHEGVVLNGGGNAIDLMTFSGGNRCLRDTRAGVALTVTNSVFSGCKTAVDVTGANVGLTNVTITGGTTGLWARGSVQAGMTDSHIVGTGIGMRLTNRGNGNQGISNTDIAALATGVLVEGTNPSTAPSVAIGDSTVSGGTSGIRSVGSPVRITRSTIQNSGVGVQMENNAVLDLSLSASAEFIGNDTSVRFVSAGKPKLDGSNLFYPKAPMTPGVTLSGTINDGLPCTSPHTIKVTSDVWEVWNVGAAAYLADDLEDGPDNITSVQGCPYALVP